VVVSSLSVRLYPGFRYDRDISGDPRAGALRVLTDFNQIALQPNALRAESVDSGLVWKELGADVAPEKRVDWQLLDNLRALDEWLRRDGVDDRRLAHAMIGKFVYLHYLRQRDILSNSRLEEWDLDPEHITRNQLWAIGNFANLADVLFGQRATLPAAAFFYAPMLKAVKEDVSGMSTEAYSPMVANQPVASAGKRGHRKATWSIVVNSSELTEIRYSDVLDGDPLPWKIAMWGSALDAKVLHDVGRRFKLVQDLEATDQLTLSQGPELRNSGSESGSTEHHPELVDKPTVEFGRLKGRRYLMRFPQDSIRRLTEREANLSKRAGIDLKLGVCRPPHVVVSVSRSFAVYTEEFLVVPSRQIGIISPAGNVKLLRAVALI
jgi:hypothetical protein